MIFKIQKQPLRPMISVKAAYLRINVFNSNKNQTKYKHNFVIYYTNHMKSLHLSNL